MPTVGEFTVTLAVKGAEAFASAIAGAQAKMISLEAAAQRMGASVGSALLSAERATVGFIRAGLAGTVEGNKLAFMFQMLSREIAGIFLPAIRAVTEITAELTRKFQALSGEQQDQILHWSLIAAGVLAVIKALTTLGLLGPLISGVGAILGAVVAAVNPVILAITAIGAAIALVKAYTDGGFGGLAKMWDGFLDAIRPVIDAVKELAAEIYKLMAEVFEALKPVAVAVFEAMVEAAKVVVVVVTQIVKAFSWLTAKIRELLEMLHLISPKANAEAAAPADNQPAAAKEPRKGGGHEVPTLATRGFESITASYARVQEAVNKRFDPALAAADHKARDERRDAKLDRLIEVIANRPAGVGP